MNADQRIAELEAKVDLFERVIRRLVENGFIWRSHSFQPLLDELGYVVVSDKKKGAVLMRKVGS